MTRLFGAGTSRRKVLRGLIGGAGAVTVAGATNRFSASAQQCRTFGETCQLNPGQGNECCEGLDCADPGAGQGICGCPSGTQWCESAGACLDPNEQCCIDDDCPHCSSCEGGDCVPYAEYCEQTGQCYNKMEGECCTDADCGDEYCVDGECSPCPVGLRYCEATDSCYTPMTGGCCPNTDDGCDGCFECVQNTCTHIENCCEDDSDCTEHCFQCESGECVQTGEYCPEGDYCYERMIGECCTDEDCGDEVCTDGHCCPPGYKYCPDGDICYTEREGECCTDADCDTACDEHHHCVECPSDEVWCETSQKCIYPPRECCTDDDCPACNTCGDDNQCTETNCCDTDNDCDSDEICCNGICVDEHDPCCQQFGETCGVLNVTSAGGDDRQYDCCDGLLCCFGQSTNVCGECCADSDCDYAPGGVCNDFQCEYPTCEGKYEACDSNSDCCHGLTCHHGVCKHPHKPHPKPTPDEPVTTLPATGSGPGKSDTSAALGITLAAGAAALLGAKMLRQQPEDAGEDA
jgi:hypothetical protein